MHTSWYNFWYTMHPKTHRMPKAHQHHPLPHHLPLPNWTVLQNTKLCTSGNILVSDLLACQALILKYAPHLTPKIPVKSPPSPTTNPEYEVQYPSNNPFFQVILSGITLQVLWILSHLRMRVPDAPCLKHLQVNKTTINSWYLQKI